MNNSSIPLSPFSCTYSSHVPEILFKLNCSIAVTTYQAGKLVFLSAKDEESIIQLPRTFDKPMGIAVDSVKDKLALACKGEVMVFANSKDLAEYYPTAPQKYDALYMPRVTYHTGPLDIHDLYLGEGNQLYAVSTLWQC